MDSGTTYRRLAMISFLHRYFLDTEADNFFGLSDVNKNLRLVFQITRGQYPLMNDLVIEPTEETARQIKAHKLIYKILPQGLMLGTAVKQETVNGVVRAKPFITPDINLRLQFTLRCRNAFASYSALRMNPLLPAIYYFTNDNPGNSKKFPSLASSIEPFQPGRIYEMGELSILSGKASQSNRRTSKSDPAHWNQLTDHRYISEYDRRLVGKKFSYSFETAGIVDAMFTLTKGGELIKTIKFSDQNGLRSVELNWNKKDDDTIIADGLYRLSVTGTNNYNWSADLQLHDPRLPGGLWGFLDLALHNSDPAFSLLDVDGCLPIDPLKYPRMELRFASRSTYWKYLFQKNPPSEVDPAWDELTAPVGISKVIISKKPIMLMKALRMVKYVAGTKSALLPNPGPAGLSNEADKICSDILLTTIKL